MTFRRPRKFVIFVLSVAVVSAVVAAVPSLRARAKAIGVIADGTGIDLPRPFARSVDVERRRLASDVVGDMYVGGEDAPVILFVPGATRRGLKDPRVVDAATALASANRRVFVPELKLYDSAFERSDIDRLDRAIERLSSDGPIGIVGFSYGGSFALIAAADARGADVAYVATFGAYFDLANVIQAITTGATILDGEEVDFDTVPEAREILTDAALGFAPEPVADELERAVEARDPSLLPPQARRIYDVLVNRNPRKMPRLVEALPDDFKETLAAFSPSSYVDDLQAPVFIMQSKRDAATPWTEVQLLADAVPDSRLVLLEHFSHVDPPDLEGWRSDGPKAWSFVSWILAAQE